MSAAKYHWTSELYRCSAQTCAALSKLAGEDAAAAARGGLAVWARERARLAARWYNRYLERGGVTCA